jgi:hypothetical protein
VGGGDLVLRPGFGAKSGGGNGPGYAAQIAAQLGAHIIKVKLPSEHIEQPAARQVYEKAQIPIATLSNRVRPVVQCTFNGRKTAIKRPGQRFT